MFDVDTFLADCTTACRETEPRLAVRDVLARALADLPAIATALPPTRAGITPLHVSADLTVLEVVWAPGMTLPIHDHRMWAAIGLYTGAEDNSFFHRDGRSVVATGGRALRPGDVCLLGADAVHQVHNPSRELAGAIHIYGGDFFATPRSEWHGSPPLEEPLDMDRLLARFDTAAVEGDEGGRGGADPGADATA